MDGKETKLSERGRKKQCRDEERQGEEDVHTGVELEPAAEY